MLWEQINSAHFLLLLRPVYFCHSRRECRISACCWRDSQKFEHQQASQIPLQPSCLSSLQITAAWSLAGCYRPPLPQPPSISNLLIHTELAGGLAFVYSWLYSHSPGCTVMFSSVVWRTPLSSTWLGKTKKRQSTS